MKPFHHAPEVTSRQRVVEAVGLAAAPVVLWVAWNVATSDLGRPTGPNAGLRVFGVAAVATLAALCVWPLWLRLREGRLWRRHRSLLARCPACGAPGEGTSGCARCGFLAPEGVGWQLVAVDPFAAAFMVGGAVAMFGLAGIFARGLAGLEPAAVAIALVIGALLASLGLALLVGAVEVVRGARRTPLRFTWRRTWQHGGVGAHTEAEVVAAPDAPVARGTTRRTLPAATALGARAPADATPFERGLAALLHAWNRSGDAPLVLERTMTWRWPSSRATPGGADGAYRAPAPTDDGGVDRAETEQWSVDFNANAFSWLLEAMKLPPLRVTEGEEAEELLDAEWCVPCAALSRVIAADDALRAAVEALGPGAPLDDPGYAVALAAARSR